MIEMRISIKFHCILQKIICKDPLLIAKSDGPKIEGQFHSSDRIVKSIQIQTGAGKREQKIATQKENQEESNFETTDSDSSLSLDYDDEVETTVEVNKRKEISSEAESESERKTVTEKEKPQKKYKKYDFNLID